MTAVRRFEAIRLTLAACAAVALFWGIRADSAGVRWAGIALLAAAVVIRLLPRRPPLD